ncbi:DNA-binding transcriptional LysR family regulator [Actinoplanes octamycinicus]|uniref:DNA-binding transcriptional LysR family regulator n=1 Tax=Actinoplanes octamycinicus TaxID=135948 RepID=A0A7W7H1L8_9ACTN|nr:LysR family transcriptional regulator [Actinoplanes octamycinicus]MBB4742318.1 DNA-binding transcriptional LysR family regulator [Actinoplanes octamycinicus]GIE59838.1 LysR family transcriptional regulator [Actinoplanes octamycinicus]
MQLSPYRMLVLRAVADAGGVTAAAARLHLAPSGVSQHLAALERESGLVLLDRSRRGGQRPVTLTAAGRQLAAHADRLAAVLADAEADVIAWSQRLEGDVRIGAFPTAVRRLVVPAVLALQSSTPGLRAAVHELDEASATAALHAGDLDLVLVEDEANALRRPPPGLVAHRLLDDPYRLAVPATWPVPGDIGDLADRPWVDGPPGSAVRGVLDRLRAATGLPLRGAHTCLEFPAALALVDAGLAVALVPDLALDPATHVVNLPGLGARTISAYVQRNRRLAPLLGAVLDALRSASTRAPIH